MFLNSCGPILMQNDYDIGIFLSKVDSQARKPCAMHPVASLGASVICADCRIPSICSQHFMTPNQFFSSGLLYSFVFHLYFLLVLEKDMQFLTCYIRSSGSIRLPRKRVKKSEINLTHTFTLILIQIFYLNSLSFHFPSFKVRDHVSNTYILANDSKMQMSFYFD